MPPFLVKNLPSKLRIAHDSQKKWRKRNWDQTLRNHQNDLDELIEIIDLFDIWSNKLQEFIAAKTLIPEIFMDAYMSIHFAGYGLYKYAYMSLRSELEMALRLVFFSTHELEFGWWLEENEWFKKNKGTYVWGGGFEYFEHIDEIRRFEIKSPNFRLISRIKGIYGRLSGSIHSGAHHFQTKPERVSPKYDKEEFNKWRARFENLQFCIQSVMILGLSNFFLAMSTTDQHKILDGGLNSYIKEKIEETLGL